MVAFAVSRFTCYSSYSVLVLIQISGILRSIVYQTSLFFEKRPSGSAIPIGGRLVQVRHQHVSTLNDVSRCLISDKRIWLRIRDPASSKRRLSVSSLRVIDLFRQWVSEVPPCISIWPKMRWPGICVADAFATGSKSGIGGCDHFSIRYV